MPQSIRRPRTLATLARRLGLSLSTLKEIRSAPGFWAEVRQRITDEHTADYREVVHKMFELAKQGDPQMIRLAIDYVERKGMGLEEVEKVSTLVGVVVAGRGGGDALHKVLRTLEEHILQADREGEEEIRRRSLLPADFQVIDGELVPVAPAGAKGPEVDRPGASRPGAAP